MPLELVVLVDKAKVAKRLTVFTGVVVRIVPIAPVVAVARQHLAGAGEVKNVVDDLVGEAC